jgi:hypothetical protein
MVKRGNRLSKASRGEVSKGKIRAAAKQGSRLNPDKVSPVLREKPSKEEVSKGRVRDSEAG